MPDPHSVYSRICGIYANDRRLADLAYSSKNCGRQSPRVRQDLAAGAAPALGGIGTAVPEAAEVIGWNYRLGEFRAAVLLAHLERFDAQAKRRDAAYTHLAA